MRFHSEELLWLLLAVPLIGVLLIWSHRRRQQELSRVGDPEAIGALCADLHPLLPAIRHVMLLFGLALAVLAAARPQIGTSSKLVRSRGIDIAVAIDVSKSMLARDIKPDRLRRARLELFDLIERLKGDRIGLVVFAGDAFVQCPLTTDYAAVKLFLDAVEVGLVPYGGTNLEAAIDKGLDLLTKGQRGAPRGRVLVLLTDAEGHDGAPLAAAERARKEGILVYAVGVGSSSGEPIPELDENGRARGYMKDRSGKTVLTRLNEALLRQIADTADGRYIHSTGGDAGIAEVHRELARLQKADFESRLFVQYDEKYQWALWPAFGFLLLATLLGERRRVGSLRPAKEGA